MMTINRDQDDKRRQMQHDRDFREYLKISHEYNRVIEEQEKIFYFIERLDNKMKDNKQRIASAQYKATRYLDPMQSRLDDEQYKNYQQQKEQQNKEALQRLEERKQKYQKYEELKQKYLKQMEEKRAEMEKNGKKLLSSKPLPKLNNQPKQQEQKKKTSFFFMSSSAQPAPKKRQPAGSSIQEQKLDLDNHCHKCQIKVKNLRNQKKQYKDYLLGEKMDDHKLDYIIKQSETFTNFEDVEKIENDKDLLNCGCDCARCNPEVPKIQLRNRRLQNKYNNNNSEQIRSNSMPKFMLFKTVKGGHQPFIKIDMQQVREQQEKFIKLRDPSRRSFDHRGWRY